MRCRLTHTTIRTGTKKTRVIKITLGTMSGHARVRPAPVPRRRGPVPAPSFARASRLTSNLAGITLHDFGGGRCWRTVLQNHPGHGVADSCSEGGVVDGVSDRLAAL